MHRCGSDTVLERTTCKYNASAIRREDRKPGYGRGNVGDEFLGNWLTSGPPAAVIQKINTFVEAGYTTIVLRFTSLDQRGQLERCVTEVLPAFQGVIAGDGEDRDLTNAPL